MPAYSQADLDAINNLISGGVSSAMIAGESVTYRSLGELLRIRAEIEGALAPASTPQQSAIYPMTSRGV